MALYSESSHLLIAHLKPVTELCLDFHSTISKTVYAFTKKMDISELSIMHFQNRIQNNETPGYLKDTRVNEYMRKLNLSANIYLTNAYTISSIGSTLVVWGSNSLPLRDGGGRRPRVAEQDLDAVPAGGAPRARALRQVLRRAARGRGPGRALAGGSSCARGDHGFGSSCVLGCFCCL